MTRFRRAEKPVKVNDLSELGKLVQQATAAAPINPPTNNAFGITPDDDDLACVWRVMADNKPRTPTEVMAALDKFQDQVHPDDIESLLRILVTNGFATRQPNRGEEEIFTLRKGLSIYMINNQDKQTKPLRAKQPALEGLSADGKIDLSEGIMVCLWKVVSDCKSRSQKQIMDLLGAYGINREVAKNAFVKAKVNLRWFDWIGSGDGTILKMKKHIKMPKVERCDPNDLKQKLTPGGIKISNIRQLAPSLVPVSRPKARRHSEAQSYDPNQQELIMTPDSVLPEAAVSTPATPLVTKKDWLDTAIWKVMSDHRGYTAAEVGVLLEEFGHNPSTVRVKISSLFLKEPHWFTRVNQKSVKNRSEYVYTLKPEIKMPGSADPEPVPEPVIQHEPVPVVAEVQPAPIETAPLKEEISMTTTNSSAPLFEVSIKIRGRDFTMSQVKQIKEELSAAGFGEPEAMAEENKFSMIELFVKIGGETFTVQEANALAIALRSV